MNGRDVVARLEALAFEGSTGDWLDVVRRSERQRALALRRRALIAAAAIVLLAVPALAVAQRLGDAFIVSANESEIDVPWVSGDTIHNFAGSDERRLAHPVWQARSHGYDLAHAIPSPDGRKLLYHTLDVTDATHATAVARVLDVDAGSDRLLGRAIFSAAWRGDGLLAYAQASVPRRRFPTLGDPGEPELGHVYVRPTLDAPAVRWTRRPSNYEVFAWARDELLVAARVASEGTVRQRFGQTQEEPGVYALRGPNRLRPLPLAAVTAVDPTGRFAVGPTTLDIHLPAEATLRVVRVSDGRILGEQALAPLATPHQPYAEPSAVSGGSWSLDYIVVGYSAESLEDDDSIGWDDVVIVLRFDGKLEPVHLFRLDRASAERADLATTGYRSTLFSPRFADAEGRMIVALGAALEEPDPARFTSRTAVLLLCDREERTCERSEKLRHDQYGIGFVENPSRPLPGP